ncbi:MAG: acetylornithine deacetylase [Burkholderiaceae bacterium]
MDPRYSIDCLRSLVAFDTVSAHPNRPLIDWAADRLDAAGMRVRLLASDDGRHANLFASAGPDEVAGVILAGHSDVVPVEGQAWRTDPFRLEERDGNLIARGAADMKGFIACVIALAPQLVASARTQPVHVALTYNEETDMRGMRELAGVLAAMDVRPAACVIGEPTSMQVVVANKGAAIFQCKIRGHPVHSSLRDRGVSAVEIAAEMIAFLNRLQQRLNGAERHDGFEFPHTSIHAGMIRGGTAHNITAQDCEFVFEIRALPGVSADALVAELQTFCEQTLLPPMRAISPACAIAITPVVNAPGLDDHGNRSLADALMPMCACHRVGRVSFGTEAGFVTAAGIPTVVCGPGDITVAHQPDEYVTIDQLGRCQDFLLTLGRRLERAPLITR